jgi:hypothetical protein
MIELHLEVGVIISWEPDHSSQVMTTIASSPEASKNKD